MSAAQTASGAPQEPRPARRAPSVAGVREAAGVIDPVFGNTPQFVSDPLSDALGLRLLCKVESLNPIRSFKGRGTSYLLHRLVADAASGGEMPRELVCGSAGNFGQGLAYAARRRGLPVTVFAATSASPLKVARMRELGAHVELAGHDFDAAKDAARDYVRGRAGARFIEDGHEPAIAEGAGTIALELDRWPEPIDVALVPLGNGALLAGVGLWLRAHRPATRVIGVCAAGAPAMADSWRAGRVVVAPAADTIADGIAVRVPVPAALDDLRGVLDEVVLVDDAAIVEAMRLLFDSLGIVVEPAGAVGVAAALAHGARFAGRLVATPLCGGNVTREQARRWLGAPA